MSIKEKHEVADVALSILLCHDLLTALFFLLAGAVIGDGQSAVASNIANTTYRLQWWDFTKYDLPEISNGMWSPMGWTVTRRDPVFSDFPLCVSAATANVLVQNCKIYNDASCDISADGQLLAAFIPSSQRGFPDEGILAVYSLAPHNLGEILFTKRFGRLKASLDLIRDMSLVWSSHSGLSSLCRSQCHLCEFVPDGPIRHGGPGLPQDPAASFHRAHGGSSLPTPETPWRGDVYEGEFISVLIGVRGLTGGVCASYTPFARKEGFWPRTLVLVGKYLYSL